MLCIFVDPYTCVVLFSFSYFFLLCRPAAAHFHCDFICISVVVFDYVLWLLRCVDLSWPPYITLYKYSALQCSVGETLNGNAL